jgi:hypothetical protein
MSNQVHFYFKKLQLEQITKTQRSRLQKTLPAFRCRFADPSFPARICDSVLCATTPVRCILGSSDAARQVRFGIKKKRPHQLSRVGLGLCHDHASNWLGKLKIETNMDIAAYLQ